LTRSSGFWPFKTASEARPRGLSNVSGVKTFDNEWILEPFERHPTFFTKRMFGGLAAYLFERQMLVLVEPTKTGRWKWHGVLICTERAHQPSICAEFPALAPHEVLRKWLFVDSAHTDFESVMQGVARCMSRNDPRFGISPRGAMPGTRRKGPRSRRSGRANSAT
jgi:hypothetical protein